MTQIFKKIERFYLLFFKKKQVKIIEKIVVLNFLSVKNGRNGFEKKVGKTRVVNKHGKRGQM